MRGARLLESRSPCGHAAAGLQRPAAPAVCSARHPPLAMRATGAAAAAAAAAAPQQPRAALAGAARRAVAPCCAAAPEGAAAAAAPAAAPVAIQNLLDLDTFPIIDNQARAAAGLVNPLVPDGTQAHVFAILDVNAKLQYIGFSKGLRTALRTMLGRRPDKAHFFKAVHFPSLDQEAMQATRDAWYAECGGAPPGNKLALERDQWQRPVDAGAISQRGKRAAAEDKSRELLTLIRQRGCTEPFTPAPELLDDGKVEFLEVAALTEEQLSAAREAAAKAAKQSRTCSVLVDGQPKSFTVRFTGRNPTNGGFLFDTVLNYDNQETRHRVVVGKEYYEPAGIEPEVPVEAALATILAQKVPRTRTPGAMLASSQFPAAYFSVGGVEQWFGDEFLAILDDMSGGRLRESGKEGDYWRFNRTQDYGPMRQEDPKNLTMALGLINPIS
ncbi:MAG: hypothetical protein J3K34DRAFT_499650 [Monoraphidium minutum]|nr:MAG: hypothetical protein J3K34DRAFT_499650 [Monoraphidium minutum]